jgi:hypothetical protein
MSVWLQNEYADKVDIVPAGEEELHIPEVVCDCNPRLGRSAYCKLLIVHNSFDGREFFENAEAVIPQALRERYRRAA